jgi:hypothetical protein
VQLALKRKIQKGKESRECLNYGGDIYREKESNVLVVIKGTFEVSGKNAKREKTDRKYAVMNFLFAVQ